MNTNNTRGYLTTFLAYTIWGFLPIYWKGLGTLSSANLLMVRVIMTSLTLMTTVFLIRRPIFLTYLRTSTQRRLLYLTAAMIGINWGVFVYAIEINQVMQASLGYYINPLLSVFLGIFFMKERLTTAQYTAIVLAAVGVIYLTVSYGQFPWIAIILAVSFAVYGLQKKRMGLDSLNSLLVEGLFCMPFTIIIVFVTGDNLSWVNTLSTTEWLLALGSGIVTLIPLVLFAEGAKRIPLSAVGFLQYIAPTLMLILSVVLYNETFTRDHAITFAFIWSGLAIYSWSLVKKLRSTAIDDSLLKST